MSFSLGLRASFRDLTKNAIGRAVSLLFLGSFLLSVCAIFVGFHHTLFDFHGFRQTQTAITAEYMEHGSFLRYETPVVGPPWSIPFEFPLYQEIVASISRHLSTPLDETGRAISILFFYLSFLPLASILRRLRFQTIQILAILALVAVSPLYIFVSRLFMIESTALFLSLMYLDQILRLTIGDRPWRYQTMVWAAIFGALAGMVKVTTFAPYLALGVGVLGWHIWKRREKARGRPALVISVLSLCVLAPVVCTSLWTKFSDIEKAKNPLGAYMTSRSLRYWNFGTLHQRLTLESYHRLWQHIYLQTGPYSAVALLILLYAILVRRWSHIVLLCLALYVGTLMLFFNLHVVHPYYSYSNAIFLIVAIGVLIAGLLALPGRKAWIGVTVLALEIFAFFHAYRQTFYPYQAQNAPGRPLAAAIIDQTTKPQDVILITGMDWSSELPYQSRRRAIMDEHIGNVTFPPGDLGPLGQEIENVGPQTIPELVACDQSRDSDRVREILQRVGLDAASALHADQCDIYVRHGG